MNTTFLLLLLLAVLASSTRADWFQLGADIGEDNDSGYGGTTASNVVVSDDGKTVAFATVPWKELFNDDPDNPTVEAIDYVRVFRWEGASWVQLGARIEPPVCPHGFGVCRVDLALANNTLAISTSDDAAIHLYHHFVLEDRTLIH